MEEKILAKVEKKKAELVDFLARLVRIPSLTGEEGAAQEFLAARARSLGMDVKLSEPDLELIFRKYPESAQYPTHWRHDLILSYDRLASYEELMKSGKSGVLNYKGRPNLVAALKGTGGGKSLLLTGHVDNVTIEPRHEWRYDPFGAQMADGLMYGRGTSDMKGGLCAALLAVQCLVEAGVRLRGDVLFASAVNEEHSGNGTLSLVAEGLRADAAIVTEPSRNQVYIATPGDVYWEVVLTGVPRSPGARWEGKTMAGVSAIEKIAPSIEALLQVERDHNRMEPHPLYRNGNSFSCVIGEVAGGTYPTVTANGCTLRGCMYFGPSLGSVNEIMDRIRDRVAEETAVDPWFKDHPAKVRFLHHRNSVTTDPEAPIIGNVFGAAKTVNPGVGPIAGCSYCSDMEYLGNQGKVPTVIMGPGWIGYAHKANECIPISEYLDCVKILALSIYRWCA
ncbi:MAG: N-formyl-4-amino-5-aminomethyl-2-methylpyrimidine deformylase [Syntrophaceae bacterium PtaU1.Bin231]|nr:MAG: N-formyl-4-amino-5-aminomethyl-2-methylpyrimidine deformylase [Syntrophaceae bacterium PtaU1.Bin231]HOG18718.1 M20/M25/M40 family metallo-hydrolase [Syntrophales bacterium]